MSDWFLNSSLQFKWLARRRKVDECNNVSKPWLHVHLLVCNTHGIWSKLSFWCRWFVCCQWSLRRKTWLSSYFLISSKDRLSRENKVESHSLRRLYSSNSDSRLTPAEGIHAFYRQSFFLFISSSHQCLTSLNHTQPVISRSNLTYKCV